MSELLPHLQPSAWAAVSAAVWMAVFIAITAWVYLPSRRSGNEEHGRLPFKDGTE